MSGDYYTREELELIVAARKAGRSIEEIAQAINRTPNAIRGTLCRLRMLPQYAEYDLGETVNHVSTPAKDEQMLQLRQQGYSDKQIACIMGLPYNTVTSRIFYLRRLHGEEAVPLKNRPYTSKEIKTALEMWREGAGRREIGEALGRDPHSVTCYINYLRRIYGEEAVPRRQRKGGKK